MDFLNGLNDRQKEAVLYGDGPLLILAGAGSGKTRVLTHRIAYLVEKKGIFPGNILAITFTNKAAKEMKERVINLLGGEIDNIWMGTFHSMCVRILRRNIDRIGYERSFSIYDRDDQITVIKECVDDLKLNRDMYKERAIINAISGLKDKMIDPDAYINQHYDNYYDRNVGEIYALYEKKLKANNALDFDDLIIKTVELLKGKADVLDYYQRKFKYIFVDEFQDTNKVQYEFVSLLSQRYKNLSVVGDDDQSIYGWRNADITNILDFEQDFPNTKIIKLEQNYRSTQNILNVANYVIRNNASRRDKRLWTENEEGKAAVIESLLNSDEEADYVANNIEELVREGYQFSDFAVLYRTNAQSRTFEEAFIRRNIPYKIVGGLRFYDRKEIKDIVAYLRLIQNPADDIALKRIINVPRRGIGNATLEKVKAYADKVGKSMYSALGDMPNLSERTSANLRAFSNMIDNFTMKKETMGLKDFLEEIIYSTGYARVLEEEAGIESQTRLENIKEFISVAIDFEFINPEGGLEDFLANVSLLSDIDKTEDIHNSVTLLTVHSAKGLEFPIVFIVGMEEGLFPISRALENEKELEEERRLCYVAITRAQKLLFITYAKLRTIYGNTNYSLPSRFINEIPADCTLNSATVSNKKCVIQVEDNEKLFKVHDHTKKIKKPKLIPHTNNTNIEQGQKIRHSKWGIGTIVQITKREDDTEIVVAFDRIGIKRLLLSIAPIELLRGE